MEHLQELKKREDEAHDLFLMTSNVLEREIERRIAITVQVLQALWVNDDSVPGADNLRCTELDWFSQGVKDNIVAHIANESFGEEMAQQILGEAE